MRTVRATRTLALAAAISLVPVAGAAAATKSVSMRDDFFSPSSVTAVQGDTVTWTNDGRSTHTTTSSFPTPVGWSSGDVRSGATYSKQLNAAGTYAYRCLRHSGMTGTALVPVRISPTTGTVTTTFTVRAARTTAPTGHAYVIERKVPGSASFAAWKTITSASVTFVPDRGTGTYAFRSSVSKVSTGQKTAPSPVRTVTVS
jgi:plastocyanin